MTMEPRRPPEYTLDVFADPTCVKDIVKAILHTIFFHRYFTPVTPLHRDLLDLTLPAIDDVDLDTLIDQRATALVRALETGTGHQQRGRGQLAIQFFEKRRRKSYFPFGTLGKGRGDEEVCWEMWMLDVTLATPRTETDVIKVRRAMEKSLQKTALKIVSIVNRDKDHIPPITTTDTNPFPYQILVNPKSEGWGQRIGIF
ncbi:autophagy-related protein [Phyllosticta citrichinensis]|uniref:Autophagy-related protein 101 n=1 Tax=Phyllosticta citrichinensis TaxID=1130410 RepID=A0ABR1XXA6_9PEZI